jgi:hypothetical protein
MWKWLNWLIDNASMMNRLGEHYQPLPIDDTTECVFAEVMQMWTVQFTNRYCEEKMPTKEFNVNQFRNDLCIALAMLPDIDKVSVPKMTVNGITTTFEFTITSSNAGPTKELTVCFDMDDVD